MAPNSVDTKCCMFNPADSTTNVELLNLGVVDMQALQMLPVVHLLHVTLDW